MGEPQAKVAVVTGGNSGIGFETAKALAAQGWRVIVTGRDRNKLARAAAAIGGGASFRVGDFADLGSVRKLAGELNQEPRIDVLINNVGIALSTRRVTVDGNDAMLQVNHLAPFLLTNLLLDKLRASAPSRIVNLASKIHMNARDHGFDDFQFERSYSVMAAYARTKLYNVLFTRKLARRLAGTGVTANAAHPGAINTEIGRSGDMGGVYAVAMFIFRRFTKPVAEGAKVPVYLATSPGVAQTSGGYFTPSLVAETPSDLALDEQAARELWTRSAKLVG